MTILPNVASETEHLLEHLELSRVDVVFRADDGVAAACFVPRIYTVPKKRPPFIFPITLSKINRFE